MKLLSTAGRNISKSVLNFTAGCTAGSKCKYGVTIIYHASPGRLKMHDLKMQDWKMTDKILANSGQNYGVWKMQDCKMTDHVN